MTAQSIAELYKFLKGIPSIINIEEGIIKNSNVIVDKNKILGSISLEEYDSIGLVRYFVFKKGLSRENVIDLVESVDSIANELNLNQVVCVADNDDISKIFEGLGYKKINKKLYLDEDSISKTNYNQSLFMSKVLHSNEKCQLQQ